MWTRIAPYATFDTGGALVDLSAKTKTSSRPLFSLPDFEIKAGNVTASQVLANWQYIVGNASTLGTGFIVLEHDLFEQSVDIATGYILPDAMAHQPKFNIKPVINCLNKPMEDAYVETNHNGTVSLPTASGELIPPVIC
jgi:hypothetical protein